MNPKINPIVNHVTLYCQNLHWSRKSFVGFDYWNKCYDYWCFFKTNLNILVTVKRKDFSDEIFITNSNILVPSVDVDGNKKFNVKECWKEVCWF